MPVTYDQESPAQHGLVLRSRSARRPIPSILACAALLLYLVLSVSSLPTIASAAGDANEAFCPTAEASPGFRSFLPDCRAFELVSPGYGGGTLATGPANLAVPIAPDGEHLVASTFSDLAESESLGENGTEVGAIYEFSRTPAGWAAEAQEPPASLYPRSNFAASSPTYPGRSVWLVAVSSKPGEENVEFATQSWVDSEAAMYAVREPLGDGKAHFTILGPAAAPGHFKLNETGEQPGAGNFRGMSADADHVIIEIATGETPIQGYVWPGDPTVIGGSYNTGFGSIYEYRDGGSNEPMLVGVKNRGAAPWRAGATHLNEGAELVSECGTKYDAISASGERVFFTAQHLEGCPGSQPSVDEVYARVGGVQTVKLSGEDDAVYRGASEDGSKVFFSEGEDLYEVAIAGEGSSAHVSSRVLISSEASGVAAVSQDGTRVYFISPAVLTGQSNGNGEIPKDGSANVYVYDTAAAPGEALSFVASGEGAQLTTKVSGETAFETTPAGAYLVFASTDQRLEGAEDTSIVAQLFEYNAATRQLARVSVGQSIPGGSECATTGVVEGRYDCDGDTTLTEDAPKLAEPPDSSISENGAVAFSSELALTPQSVPGRKLAGATENIRAENVYEYRNGEVYLISPGDEETPPAFHDEEETRLLGIDESGRDLFFVTADGLVPQDADTQVSWYDAREGGGFPAPPSALSCSGEACQGALSIAPAFSAPASNTLTGAGNLAPPVEPKSTAKPKAKVKAKPCKKGFTKKKNKCVRSEPKAKKAGRDRRGN
jgi:hypothetical protein